MYRGFLLVWRRIEDSGLLQDGKTLALFLHLLLKARVEAGDFVMTEPTRAVVRLRRGQVFVGRKSLAATLDQTEREIRTGLKMLREMGICDQQPTNRGTIVTIRNYDRFQHRKGESYVHFIRRVTSHTTITRPSRDHKVRMSKNVKGRRKRTGEKTIPSADELREQDRRRRAKKNGGDHD